MWSDLLEKNSIFSLFPKSVLGDLTLDKYIKNYSKGEQINVAGEKCEFLYIPLSINLDMSTLADKNKIGSIKAGRSPNLYSFIRDLPSQYAFTASESGSVLLLPAPLVQSWFLKYPNVLTYLQKVTGDQNFLTLSKELRKLGIKQTFTNDFISLLEEVSLTPQNYLAIHDQAPTHIHYLVEGKFLSRNSSALHNSWILPLKTWINWENVSSQRLCSQTVVTLSKSVCFRCKIHDLEKLKQSYPVDFNILNQWIVAGIKNEVADDDDDEIISKVVDLFKDSAVIKRKWYWQLPWVKQNDEMDCGPACLAMVSQYFGKNVSVPFWRSKLSTDRNGTSLFDLAIATENTGFISHCLHVENIQELDSFLLPFIALRKFHYLVVYKIKKESVIVGDPGIGIREMSIADFNDGFENAGLFLKPNTDFEHIPESPSNWKHFLHLFSGLEKDMTLALTCSLMGVFVGLIPPIISQLTLDEVLVRRDQNLLWILIGVAFGVTLISSFISWAERYYFVFIMGKFNFRANSVFLQKTLSLPFQFFAKRHVGDFTHRLAEMAHLRGFVTNTLFSVILNLITMSIYGFALALISTKAALLVLILAPPILIIPLLTSKYMSRLYNEIFAKSSEQYSYITDLIKGIAAIKTMGAETTARFRYETRMLGVVQLENKFSMASVNIDVLTSGYFRFANLAIMAATVYMGLQGELSAGKVISFSIIANSVFTPLLTIAKHWDQFIEMKSILSRLNDIFLTPSDQIATAQKRGFIKPENFAGEIEFKDVWFRYGGEATSWVLQGINFKIEPGQKVAIVGPSGSGKSTLVYLLTRMYEPTSGQILIDGRDYRDYDLQWLRTQVGLLLQESHLFEGIIADNIALNSMEHDDNRLKQATVKAGATNLIQKKESGFEYNIPHGGLGFSGGEKQKLALARLFYQNPSIILLDEATSSLDGIAEAEILEQISTQHKSNTIISIAHRYSTVLSSDYGLVLLDGKVVGFGSLKHLEETNQIYQRLFNLRPATQIDDDLEEIAS